MTVKLNKLDGSNNAGKNPTELLILLAKQSQKLKVEQSVAALTDNSSGDATPAADSVQTVGAFANEADAGGGGSSADATAAAAVLVTVKNAITELVAKTNEYAEVLGLAELTDNSGGAAVDGTIAAIDTTVTAATTGAQATETNAARLTINAAFLEIGTKVNEIASALGLEELTLDDTATTPDGTVAAVTTAVGSAADPAVSKTAFDAAVVKWTDNVAFIAAKLNEFRTVAPVEIVAV
mgnify:CR=1 FL=1